VEKCRSIAQKLAAFSRGTGPQSYSITEGVLCNAHAKVLAKCRWDEKTTVYAAQI
jgi:hypothetical protein